MVQADTTPLPTGRPPAVPPASATPASPAAPSYVSPADFHAVAREANAGGRVAAGGKAVAHGGRVTDARTLAAAPLPRALSRRSTTDIVLLVLKNSLLVFVLLFVASFCISLFLVGAIFSGSESGFYIGLGLQFAAEALLIIWGGYRTSMEAMERNRGWMYGVGCVAGVVFFWQPLVAFILSLFLTGRPILPQTFSLVGIMVVILLLLPLGALGGWLAEKRYMG